MLNLDVVLPRALNRYSRRCTRETDLFGKVPNQKVNRVVDTKSAHLSIQSLHRPELAITIGGAL